VASEELSDLPKVSQQSTINSRMATIVHLSDLHFGRVSPVLCDQVLQFIGRERPRLTVISGDLTQRAREKQYLAARRFIDQIPGPVVVVPGNHDVPMYDVLRRFFRPLERFTRIITPDLWPTYRDDELFILGANTTRAFTCDPHAFWKNGTLSEAQLAEIGGRFAQARPLALRVLVIHHPLVNPWNDGLRDTAVGRERIIRSLEGARVQVVLSGHLHFAYGRQAPRPKMPPGQILCIQAGTATSTRLRQGEANAFSVLHWDGRTLTLSVMRHNGREFFPESEQQFSVT
jgi:3',5'-cyclic AMP phosphodiesterase CpdA